MNSFLSPVNIKTLMKNDEIKELNKCYICNTYVEKLELHFLNSHIVVSDKTTETEEDVAIIEEKFRENKKCPRSSPQHNTDKLDTEEEIAINFEEKLRENENSQNLYQLRCHGCAMVFHNSQMFLNHSITCRFQNFQNSYWCKMCQIPFSTKKSLVDHVANKIFQNNLGKDLASDWSMPNQMYQSEPLGTVSIKRTIESAIKETNQRPKIKKITAPKKIVNKKSSEEYWCKFCQISFSRKKSLVEHVAKNICKFVVQHRKAKKPEKENVNKPETEEEDLTIIEENIRQTKSQKPKKLEKEKIKELASIEYKCNLCNISFSSSKFLVYHMGTNVHVNDDK